MELHVRMIPAPDDPDDQSPAYQEELAAFARYLQRSGIEYQAKPGKLLFTDSSPFNFAGTFVITLKALTPILTPIIGAIGGYLHGKRGRGVSFEMGKDGQFKGSAQNIEDAEKLLRQLVPESQKRIPAKAAKTKPVGKKREKDKSR
jgi:hypothetical protein